MRIFDWKLLPDGREKYQAYLCSPEWGGRRAAVERRSGGMCERGCGRIATPPSTGGGSVTLCSTRRSLCGTS
jgi:hypothetical protein